jgi:hypothetical protein
MYRISLMYDTNEVDKGTTFDKNQLVNRGGKISSTTKKIRVLLLK